MASNLKQRAMAPAQQGQPTLAQLIDQMKPEIARALPRHMNPDRMARIATTVLRQTPALARCTPDSFLGALMTASQLGLEPGPLGEAYLVPYGNTVTFVPGYRGLIKLAYQSGEVSTFNAQVVREGDEFDYGLGLEPYLVHKPKLSTGDIAKPIAVYAVLIRKDGAKDFRVMSVAEVERIRRRSKASNNGPWKTDWESMAKKTVIKQLAKFAPLASENFNAAQVADGTIRTDTADLADAATTFVDGDMIDGDTPQIDAPADPQVDRDSLEAAVLAAIDAAGHTDIAAFLSSQFGDQIDGVTDLTEQELDSLLASLDQKGQ